VRRRNAFTLVEMLVVMGIVSLLAAIVFPVTSIVMSYAHKTGCVSNLRQLGMAVNVYTDHNDGYYPCASVMPSTEPKPGLPRIRDLLEPYAAADVFRCPCDSPTDPAYKLGSYFEGEGSSYEWAEIFNYLQVGQQPGFLPFKLATVPMLRDYEAFHKRGGNIGLNGYFIDGHVESF
jgi:prepilin-type N-terminal cleavage/methylation domain-containing protein